MIKPKKLPGFPGKPRVEVMDHTVGVIRDVWFYVSQSTREWKLEGPTRRSAESAVAAWNAACYRATK